MKKRLCRKGDRKLMKKIIGIKILQFIGSVLMVSLFLFSVFYFLKGDSSSVMLGEEVTDGVRNNYMESSKLNVGFLSGYLGSMYRFFSLDWGKSISGESIKDGVRTSLGVSLSLAFYALLLSFPFSLWLSIRAVRKKGFSALFLALFSALFFLLPSFLSSIILIIIFSSVLRLFPVAGYAGIESGYIAHLHSLFLPSLALSLMNTAFMLRVFRETLEENMTKPFVNYARAKGVKEKSLVVKSALKPSLGVIITTTAQSIVSFFASATVVETVFALPGMGRALVRSASMRDYSQSFVLVMIMVLVISLVLFISRILTTLLDRRGERENGKA